MVVGAGAGTWGRRAIWVIVGLLVCYGLLFVYHAGRLAFEPSELNYAEGVWLFSAIRVRHGLPMYFDYSHAPYIAMVYPPLDPGVAGLAASLLGLSDDGVVFVARLLTLAATLATAGAVFMLARRLGAQTPAAALGALLFFTPSHTYALWSFVARADMLAVALGVWGVAVLAWRPKDWGLVAAGLLCALALCAKQTAVAPPLAGTWWLLGRDRHGGLPLFLGGSLLGLLLALGPLGLEGINRLVLSTLDLTGEPWSRGPFQARIIDVLTLFGVLVPVAIFGLVRATDVPEGRLLVRYAALAMAVFLVSAGKVGSASSYALELIAILCVLCAVGVQSLLEVRWRRRGLALGALALAVVALGGQVAQAYGAVQNYPDPNANDGLLLADVVAQSGPIYSENGYIMLHGADPPFMLDPFYFSALAARGKWDPAQLCALFDARHFSAVVLTHKAEAATAVQGVTREPPGVDAAVAANYTLQGKEGRYYVYVPKR